VEGLGVGIADWGIVRVTRAVVSRGGSLCKGESPIQRTWFDSAHNDILNAHPEITSVIVTFFTPSGCPVKLGGSSKALCETKILY